MTVAAAGSAPPGAGADCCKASENFTPTTRSRCWPSSDDVIGLNVLLVADGMFGAAGGILIVNCGFVLVADVMFAAASRRVEGSDAVILRVSGEPNVNVRGSVNKS